MVQNGEGNNGIAAVDQAGVVVTHLCKRLSNWSINTKVIGDSKPQNEE